jgi:16S rRNA (guanine527-N7)-methyltransferase
MALTALPDTEGIWNRFFSRVPSAAAQQEQFRTYYRLLVETNDIHNLTAITDLEKVLTDHFEDSLALARFIDCSRLTCVGDIGTGAGFPALPLKIAFPELPLVLIEVNHKKIQFLESVVEALQLSNVTITDLDWRTFLRKTDYEIDLFCARASLQPEELVRMFMPSSAYKDARLAYWASRHWQPSVALQPLIEKQETYTVGAKERKLIFFKRTERSV